MSQLKGENELNKNNILAIIAIAMVMIAPIVSAEEIEIRGTIATDDITYDYTNFAGFWYDIDLNESSENLIINVTGRDVDIVYQCEPKIVAYENPELGNYTIIGWMAEKYVCYDGKSDELVRLLIEWDDNDDKILQVNELLEMPEGYTLVPKEIDLDGGKVYLTLYKDGIILDSGVIPDNTIYKYYDDNDVLTCSVKISQIFRGTDVNMVIVEYLYLQSENILDIDTGDNFGVMEVTSTANGITLKNDDSVELSEDDEIEIMENLYFKVADSPTLRYYLAKMVSLECEECEVCEACPESEPCPEMTPCPECPEVPEMNATMNETELVVKELVDPPAVPEPKTSTGRWGNIVLAICGLGVIGYLVWNQGRKGGKAITAD